MPVPEARTYLQRKVNKSSQLISLGTAVNLHVVAVHMHRVCAGEGVVVDHQAD